MASGGSTKTSQNINSTTKQTPDVPSWLSQPYQGLVGAIGSAAFGSPATAGGLDWTEYMKRPEVAAGPDNATNSDPAGWARSYAASHPNDQPNMIGASGGSPGITAAQLVTPANANQQQAWMRGAQVNPGIAGLTAATTFQPSNITPGSLATTDLTPYMNKFDSGVIDPTLSDWMRGRGMAQTADDSRAGLAGAFGGSRDGVVRAETSRAYDDNLSRTLAGLHQASFDKATGLAGTDISNKLAADSANAANGITGANLRLNAAGQLSEQTRADIAQLATLGEQERAVAIENNPELAELKRLGVLDSLLAQIPAGDFIGQTAVTNGTTTSTSTKTPGLLDIAGTALGAFAPIHIPGLGG